MDFLIVPTVGFKLLFVLVILRLQRRRLSSLCVTANPTAEWIARQIIDAFPGTKLPPISSGTVTHPMAMQSAGVSQP
jgi:hypothetical protein